ncbi:MAG TPA: tripartite tricarboxylate transporter substrate binding protein [Rhizobacter sp.]
MIATRRRVVLGCAALVAAPAVRGADAPLRIVVAYPTGGVSDEIARLLAERLAIERGQPVMVENRPGNGGGIAMEMLARAPADGRLLVFSALSPLTMHPLRYDPLRDIAPVAAVMATATLVAGTSALPAESFAQMVALARAQPGTLRWATTGVGTTGHRVFEAIASALALQMVHIPYKGGGQSLVDALGGQFELMSTNVAATQLRLVAQQRLKALAVGAPRRLPALPAVPTLAELGVPQANLVSRFGLFAPGAAPRPWRDEVNAQVQRALRSPVLQARLRAGHNETAVGGVDPFEAAVCAELARPAGCHR